jgi:hypothetical protein
MQPRPLVTRAWYARRAVLVPSSIGACQPACMRQDIERFPRGTLSPSLSTATLWLQHTDAARTSIAMKMTG